MEVNSQFILRKNNHARWMYYYFLPNLTETSDSLSTETPFHSNFETRAKPCCGSAAVSADESVALANWGNTVTKFG